MNFGFGFERLPHIGVERAFGDIAVNLHARIFIALPENASFALFHVRRPPRRIEMMKRNQPLLHIGAGPHFLRAAEKNAHLARADGSEKRQLRVVRVVILDEGDFGCGNAQPFQLVGHVIVNGKATVLRRGQIAEDKLRQTVVLGRVPNAMNVFDRQIYFALGMIRHMRLHQPQIQRGLAALGGDFEHVVLARIDPPAFQLFGASRPDCQQTPSVPADAGACGWPVFPLPISDGQIEHLRRLHVRRPAGNCCISSGTFTNRANRVFSR